jgi:cytochrome P450/NADPH-cytochrome P450 reductase
VRALPWVVGRAGILERLRAHGERYRGEGAFRVPMPDGREPIFVVNASLSTELCDESRFEKVLDGPLVYIREFAGDGLFTAHPDEPNWHLAHRILSPGFSTGSLERYFPAMRESLDALVQHWRRAEGPVDVVTDMTRLTLDTISLCGFDHRFDSFARPELHPFLQSLARTLQESVDVLSRPAALAPLFRHKRERFTRDIAAMFTLVDDVIRQRKSRARAEWPKDFLSLMLEQPDPKTGQTLSDENIRYQILTFLVAGHETTAGLLSFALHQLAREPALAARLRREIDEKIGDREPTMQDVLGLDLLQRTLHEALRLWPTVPGLTRAAREDTVLGGRYRVEKGQPFGLLVAAIHRDPAVWKSPERFDPDRFLPEANRARPAGAYKPFGIGRRSCTGRHFALIEASLCLAVVLREFSLEDPGPLSLTPTVSPKPRSFRLGLQRRRWRD